MKKAVLNLLILFFSLFCEYTFLPLLPFPLNQLSFILLSFVFFSLYETHRFLIIAITTGLAKDILSSSPWGIYTLTFFLSGYLILKCSKGIIKDKVGVKLAYTFITVILVSLLSRGMEGIWGGNFYIFNLGVLFKRGLINGIFFPLWSGLLSWIRK
ncbi:MAG: rod shape-determining protein MreD [Candidatus Omnitrophica bacterium]|nr:rod shape-determining protein MreD [Candidatus Omnitrophota bacterium]MCM8797965.1 rod shape-determining protein MreD [Candidatus Omnitrophota bacterium]